MPKLFWTRILGVSLLSSCYVTKQGYHQLSLMASREPIDHLLCEDKISDHEREKLGLSQKILKFAKDEGLTIDDSYKHYIKIKGHAVSYIVQAAKPTEMKLRHWWFPVVGSVPYLGFFEEADRDEESRKLESEGFEVYKGSVTAFSSLGWFSDPIYSSMLNRGDVELANLLFHELTHRTLWVKGGADFNENLAEFIADELTQKYFRKARREEELREFEETRFDYANFKVWLFQLRADLEKYFADHQSIAADVLKIEKSKIIELAVSKKPSFKRVDFVGSGPWNNARVLAAGLYLPDTAKFLAGSTCFRTEGEGLNVGKFLKALEQSSENADTGFAALEKLCPQ